MNFLDSLKEEIMLFDGATGTMLQRRGLNASQCPELWNIEFPEKVRDIHRAYKAAGARVLETNTFGANRIKLGKFQLSDRVSKLNQEGVKLAREVMGDEGWVAASIGPTGDFLKPYGSLSFEEMYDIFKEQINALALAGADLIMIETMVDANEARVALLAAKENCSLPVFCSFTFETNGRTLMGNDPVTVVNIVQSLGADGIGVNCSGGPEELSLILQQMKKLSSIPIIVQPNAGIPQVVQNETVYPFSPKEMAQKMKIIVDNGANAIGGCCGTCEEHIAEMGKILIGRSPIPPRSEPLSMVSSTRVSVPLHQALESAYRLPLSPDIPVYGLIDLVLNIPSDAQAVILDTVQGLSSPVHEILEEIGQYVKMPLLFAVKDVEQAASLLRYYQGVTGIYPYPACDESEFGLLLKRYGAFLLKS